MAGANYMGGKRNAAKARSRDTTGRLQRGHFSRQRLGILSTGLISRKSAGPPAICASSIHDISLQHAKLDLELRPDLPVVESCHAEPPASRPSTSFSKSSNPTALRSKLLQVIDTSESLSLRAQIDRILAVPDFLGLTTYRRNSNVRRNYSRTGPSPYRPGSVLSSGPDSSPLSKRGCVDGNKANITTCYVRNSDNNRNIEPPGSHPSCNIAPLLSHHVSSPRAGLSIDQSNTLYLTQDEISSFGRACVDAHETSKSRRQGISEHRSTPKPSRPYSYVHQSRINPNIYPTPSSQLNAPSGSPCKFISFSSPPHPISHTTSPAVSAPQGHTKLNTYSTGNDVAGDVFLDEAANLLESLYRSSDPWALMGQKLLGLSMPSPSSRVRIRAQDTELLQASMSKAGVGFVGLAELESTHSTPRGNSFVNTSPWTTHLRNTTYEQYEDDREVFLNFDSSQPSPGHFFALQDVSLGTGEQNERKYPANRMEPPLVAERLISPDYDVDDYLPPSDPEPFSSSSTGLAQTGLVNAATTKASVTCDIEMEDILRENNAAVYGITLDVLSPQISENDDELEYSADHNPDPEESLPLFLRQSSSSEKQFISAVVNDESELDGLDEAQLATPLGHQNQDLVHNDRPWYSETKASDSLVETRIQTAPRLSVPNAYAFTLEGSNSNAMHAGASLYTKPTTFKTIDELGQADSQLLTMYTCSDNQNAPAKGSLQVHVDPVDSTMPAIRASKLEISMNKNTQDADDEENVYDGPCLFFDQEDEEE